MFTLSVLKCGKCSRNDAWKSTSSDNFAPSLAYISRQMTHFDFAHKKLPRENAKKHKSLDASLEIHISIAVQLANR